MKADLIITDREILRQISRSTTPEEVDSLDLEKRLRDANRTAWTSGCGLSAIQIGVPLRFAWYVFNGRECTLINPVITQKIGVIKDQEGCLSIPNKFTPDVERAYEIEYEVFGGKKKRAKGFLARVIQHEIDHMNGILIDEK